MPPSDHARPPSLLYTVKRLELVIKARLDQVLKGSGVTTLQYTALTVLQHRDGISAAQLARDSFVTPQSMADMLRALEARGLISRRANPDSRRELLVHLTSAGAAFLDEYAAAARAVETRMTEGLSREEVASLRTTLTTAWLNLRDDTAPGSRSPS